MKKMKVVTLLRRKEDINHILNRYLCSESDIKGLSDRTFVLLASDSLDKLALLPPSSERFYAQQLAGRIYCHSRSA